MSAAETRAALERARSAADEHCVKLSDLQFEVGRLETQLAREEAAEREAASKPQAPAIPEDVLERAWNETLAVGRGFAYWSETRSQGDARAFAAAIAAHVVAQGTRVTVEPDGTVALLRRQPAVFWNGPPSRPAVLLYTDGQP